MLNLFGDLLTWIFAPLLKLPFAVVILLISMLVACVLAVISAILIDRKKFSELKKRMHELQEEMKRVQKENPERANELTKEILKLTHEQMLMNTKPMLASIFVVIIFLPWISSISLYEAGFDENGKGVFRVNYFVEKPALLNFEVRETGIAIAGKEIKSGETFRFEKNWYRVNGIDKEGKKVHFGTVVRTPFQLPFFSYGFGWLMWYIVCSSFFLYLFRRLAGI